MGIIGKAPVSNASFGNPARVYQQVVPVSININDKENGSITTTTQPFYLKTLKTSYTIFRIIEPFPTSVTAPPSQVRIGTAGPGLGRGYYLG